jgi:hypothetical protein
MATEPPAKVRVDRTPRAKAPPTPEAAAVEYIRGWARATERARSDQRDAPLSRRLWAVALLLDRRALRAPAELIRLAPGHPAMRLDRALVALRAAVVRRQEPVTRYSVITR